MVLHSVKTVARSRVIDMICRAGGQILCTNLTERLIRKSLVIARGECRGHGGQKNAMPWISQSRTHVLHQASMRRKLILNLFQTPTQTCKYLFERFASVTTEQRQVAATCLSVRKVLETESSVAGLWVHWLPTDPHCPPSKKPSSTLTEGVVDSPCCSHKPCRRKKQNQKEMGKWNLTRNVHKR